MGMDKIDNVKSAIASATAVDSKKRPGVVAPASNNEGGQAGVVVPQRRLTLLASLKMYRLFPLKH